MARRERAMTAGQVLARLSAQARADIGAYVREEDGALVVDLAGLKRDGLTHLIREIRQTPQGIEVKLHDAQAALIQLGKHYGLFAERMAVDWRRELTQEGIDPDAALEAFSAQLEALVRRGAGAADGGGAGTGEGKD